MTTAESENDAEGRFLLKVSTDALSPVIMYVLAVIGAILGGIILCATAPMLFETRRGDFTGGLAGCTVAAILLGAGYLAFRAGRSRTTIYRLVFTTQGVLMEREGAVLCPWNDLPHFRITIWKPSATTKAIVITKGVASLLTGNAAGVGHAAGLATFRGVIFLRFPGGRLITATSMDVEGLEAVADCATKAGREDVLTVVT